MALDPYIIKRPITAVADMKPKPKPKRGMSSTKYTMRDPATLNAKEQLIHNMVHSQEF